MESTLSVTRPRCPPSPMAYHDAIKNSAAEYDHRRASLTSLNGTSRTPNMYSGPPPPYSYPSSTISLMPAMTGLASPPDSRRTSGDEKESKPMLKLSLPSIQEALGSTPPCSHPGQSLPKTTSQTSPCSPRNLSSGPSIVQIPRSNPSEPPHADLKYTFTSQSASTTPYNTQPPPSSSSHAVSHIPYAQPEFRRSSVSSSFIGDRLPSLRSLRNASSPEQASTSDRYPVSYNRSSPRPELQGQLPHASATASLSYSHYPHDPYHYHPPPPSNVVHPLSQPPMPYLPHHTTYPPPLHSRFDGTENGRAPEAQSEDYNKSFKSVNGNGERYGTSVKRHLDYFDLENSLNEITDCSARVNDFSRDFKDRARELPRTGPGPGVLPSIAECDAMISYQNRVQDLLIRVREMLVSQQNAVVSQPGAEQGYKAHGEYDADESGTYDDGKGGAFMGPDAKKRRGRAAPPGRCHSCNRAETPEWRRGPDGARTLCNACGLHYAKLTRKMGTKGTVPGPSSLRPKDLSPGSPQ